MAKGEKVAGKNLMTPEFRVSFPAVFQARAAVAGQEPKFSLGMLWPKTADLSELKAAIRAAATIKWGVDPAKWPKNLRSPLRDGAEKDYDGYGPGVVFASASSKMRPGVVDQDVKPIIEPSEFYGGCYARATISVYAYDIAGNRGVAFGLRNVQKIRDGEAFSGATKPEEDFDVIPLPKGSTRGDAGVSAGVGVSAEDPLGI